MFFSLLSLLFTVIVVVVLFLFFDVGNTNGNENSSVTGGDFDFLVNPELYESDIEEDCDNTLNSSFNNESNENHDQFIKERHRVRSVSVETPHNTRTITVIGISESNKNIKKFVGANMIHKINENDLIWLLFKDTLNVKEFTQLEIKNAIIKKLTKKVYCFIVLICKMFRKSNDELATLLRDSLQRLQKTQQFAAFVKH